MFFSRLRGFTKRTRRFPDTAGIFPIIPDRFSKAGKWEISSCCRLLTVRRRERFCRLKPEVCRAGRNAIWVHIRRFSERDHRFRSHLNRFLFAEDGGRRRCHHAITTVWLVHSFIPYSITIITEDTNSRDDFHMIRFNEEWIFMIQSWF